MNVSHYCAAVLTLGLQTLIIPDAAATAGGLPSAPFPLGIATLAEGRTRDEIAPGVFLHVVRRGQARVASRWVVTAGVARSPIERHQATACLRRIGLASTFQSYPVPGDTAASYVEVTGGSYANENAARRVARRRAGCTLKARAVAASPLDQGGPWRLHIVEIQPRQFRGRIFSALARETGFGRERLTTIARRHKALVAINGGFFAMTAAEGIVGEPAGIAVIDGRVRSEPTANRPYLLLSGGGEVGARIVPGTANALRVTWSDGTSTPLTGVDRDPGRVRNCGTGGDAPAQDLTCRPVDDLVAITPQAGFRPRASGAVTAIVARDGQLAAGRSPRSGEVLLAGIGKGAALLSRQRAAGVRAEVDLSVAALTGSVRDERFAVNGGPLLIRNGKIVRDDDREGWNMAGVSRQRAAFVHDWATLRNPRTAVGIGADDTIWFVIAEGREFAERGSRDSAASAGLSIEELRTVMAHLRVRDAINLDGGGSSMLVINGAPATKPSDPGGERAIGDAIVLTR